MTNRGPQMENDEQRVKAVYPNAEVKSSDYYRHWIGLPSLSDSFEEEGLDEVYRDNSLSDEEAEKKLLAIRAAAIGKAWADAASRLAAVCQCGHIRWQHTSDHMAVCKVCYCSGFFTEPAAAPEAKGDTK